MKFRFSDHALQEMERRQVSTEILETVLSSPQQILDAREGRQIYQSRVEINRKIYLIRAIVENDPVITVYRTSKIEKYWSEP
jgi:hypothetical protein